MHRHEDRVGAAVFVSRGDDSGTNAKERDIWTKAAISRPVPGTSRRARAWARRCGSRTRRPATPSRTARPTSRSAGHLGLAILGEGDAGLLDVYHVIEMTTKAGDRVQPDGAQAFADWIGSPSAQQRIGQFGTAKFGQPLFTPDAGKDATALGR